MANPEAVWQRGLIFTSTFCATAFLARLIEPQSSNSQVVMRASSEPGRSSSFIPFGRPTGARRTVWLLTKRLETALGTFAQSAILTASHSQGLASACSHRVSRTPSNRVTLRSSSASRASASRAAFAELPPPRAVRRPGYDPVRCDTPSPCPLLQLRQLAVGLGLGSILCRLHHLKPFQDLAARQLERGQQLA